LFVWVGRWCGRWKGRGGQLLDCPVDRSIGLSTHPYAYLHDAKMVPDLNDGPPVSGSLTPAPAAAAAALPATCSSSSSVTSRSTLVGAAATPLALARGRGPLALAAAVIIAVSTLATRETPDLNWPQPTPRQPPPATTDGQARTRAAGPSTPHPSRS
jgi:hypothetical protein